MINQTFSDNLQTWLQSKESKDLSSLINVFGERSIAIVIFVLMLFPALPIPTGGITHVLEFIAMILALEMIAGRKTIWLPKKLLRRNLGDLAQKKVIPFVINRVRWFEKHSSPWGRHYINNDWFIRVSGIILLVLAVNAFISPPFSGLDTLPSFSAVLICLALILEDMKYYIIGFIVGIASVTIYIFFGTLIIEYVQKILNYVI